MNGESMNRAEIWAKLRAEYVNSDISLPALAQKHGVSLSAVKRKSGKEKWSEKRRQTAESKAQKVSEKIAEREVKQTVRDIERCCKAAGKLIDKVNKAISQIDKEVYVSNDDVELISTESKDGDAVRVHTVKKRTMRTKQHKVLVNTKRLSELSKTLVNLKAVLTGDNGQADSTGEAGVIEISAATAIDPREDENEEDMDAAAETGVYDVEAGG